MEDVYDLSPFLELARQTLVVPVGLVNLKEELDFFNDDKVCEIIGEVNKGYYIFQKDMWYCFDDKFKRWTRNKRPHVLIKDLPNIVRTYLKNKMAPYAKLNGNKRSTETERLYNLVSLVIDKVINHYSNNSGIQGLVTLAQSHFINDIIKFDMKKHLLGFENGVYDLDGGKLRDYCYDDFMTMSCKYSFVKICRDDETYIEVMNVLTKIHPDKNMLKLILMMYASGLYGQCVERFFLLNGEGRNGKGMINEFIETCLGDYFYIVSASLLTQKQKASGNADPQLANISKKRIVVCREPNPDDQLNNGLIKELTGGGTINARACFSNETDCHLHLTLILETNDRIKLADPPKVAEAQRILDLLYRSYFGEDIEEDNPTTRQYKLVKEYKTDEWKQKHACAMMTILMEHFAMYKNDEYKFNKVLDENPYVKDRSQAYLNDCNPCANLMDEYAVPSSDSKLLKVKDIVDELEMTKAYQKMSKRQQKVINVKKMSELFFSQSKYNYSTQDKTIRGWKLNIDENN